MKIRRLLKKTIGVILILLMLFSLFGCQWLIPEDETPDTNEPESSPGENDPQEPAGEGEDITFQPDDELIESLWEYLENFRITNDLAESNFAWTIDMCKFGYTPILVDFGEECYYVAAYYYAKDEDYLSYRDYHWVGFTHAESVLEKWEDMTCIIAFQINPAEYCENIRTGDTDFTVELFTYYQPEFIDGKALTPNISSGNPLIVMDDSTTDKMYYSSKVFHGILNLECIKLDGDYYVIQYHGSEWTNGKRIENDLHNEYGDYYDYIMEIMVDAYSVVTGERTDYYGRFKLDDIAKLMK